MNRRCELCPAVFEIKKHGSSRRYCLACRGNVKRKRERERMRRRYAAQKAARD